MSSADAVAKLADLVKAAELFEAAGRTHIPVPIADIRRIHEAVKVAFLRGWGKRGRLIA